MALSHPPLDNRQVWPLVRRLFVERGRPFIGSYALAFVFMGLVAATTAMSAWLMKDVINRVFIDRDVHALQMIALAVVAIYAVKGMASYWSAVLLARVGNKIIALVQRDLIAKLLRQDLGYLQGRSSNDVATIMSFNAISARGVIELLVTSIGRDILSLIGLVTVMLLQDPWLSLIMLSVLPIAALFIRRIVKRTGKVAGLSYTLITDMASQVREIAQGFRVVKAFGMEERLTERVNATIAGTERYSNKYTSLQARTSPIMETLGGIAIAAVIAIGGWRVISQGEAPGEFFSFIAALLLAYEPAKRLAKMRIQLQNGLVGVKQMYDFLDQDESLIERDGLPALARDASTIRFEGVTFGYDEGRPVLRGLSFTAPAGQTTAIVGLSGSGKSTVMSLILRFWDPQSGRILIGEQDVRTVSVGSLRAATAYVGQDAFLFDGTVRDNILAGARAANDADVVAAAVSAQAHDFILGLPQGYDTRVGELGSLLSGGQRQRIAIARAFLRNAPILLLDEPTSALDAASESAIQDGLARLTEARTTLVIAHRLSTVQAADQIIVLDQGRIIESGRHADLMARGGVYARLTELQWSGRESSASDEPSPLASDGGSVVG
jgi:ATP-binding cassette subfamily B protein